MLIHNLSLPQLEMGEALLDLTSESDLTNWLVFRVKSFEGLLDPRLLKEVGDLVLSKGSKLMT